MKKKVCKPHVFSAKEDEMTKYKLTKRKENDADYCKRIPTALLDELGKKINKVVFKQKRYREKGFTARQLAQELNTNSRYVSATLCIKFRQNFKELVNRCRVAEAMSILTDVRYDDYRMEDVAETVGFSSRQTFYAGFYKVNGISPKEYKKQYFARLQAEKQMEKEEK